MPEGPRGPGEPPSRRAAMIGLLVALALVVLGLVFVKLLGQSTRIEDCGLSGR